ncbi:aldo/keto reductase [Marinobacter sp. AC-23]|uniref:aldo/keto reductase n=1 Tax=Marinobacter sp. AC-23 TaxID=1879031 RepID=UPI0008DCE509|nr:aldo/keto reductase [Marinobacter sp. AC-23]OHY79316.1 aldo/keto reductase [Marinobacter sp. AC-23]
MQYRKLGRLGWDVSEVGYGMWGIAGGEGGWTGADDESGIESLHEAVQQGVNYFDTAWIYGRGYSEKLLGRLVRETKAAKRLYIATKIPPKNRIFPSQRTDRFDELFPKDYLQEYVERSLTNLGTDSIDLLQFHVWEDAWAFGDDWKKIVEDWRRQGLVKGIGISVNRWEPWNCLESLRTGLIDSVQVIYNIFDQAPEDVLLKVCEQLDIAVIARVPFDEGTLTGTLRKDMTWPEGDWRNSYFVPENLTASVARAQALRPITPEGWTMAELALRFILHHPAVSTTIPGMRKLQHVLANTAVSDGSSLPPALLSELRKHRWDRVPTWWSQ